MAGWRDQILKKFKPQIARLTLVADPDSLLLEEGILKGIHELGLELITFEDHVAFRYAFEVKFRTRWDRGEETEHVVVRSPKENLDALPYDLLQIGRRLSLSLSDLFPNISYPVVATLDRADLDVLDNALKQYTPGTLGENATKDFILRHVFEIAPELIKTPSDLLQVLLRRHYKGMRVPAIIDEYFVQVLRTSNMFKDWPLEKIVPDPHSFFAFLQERWPVFLNSLVKRENCELHDDITNFTFEIPGPTLLPFDHPDVRIYIDNLFLEGHMTPVPYAHAETLANTWIAHGIIASSWETDYSRLEGLLETIEDDLPDNEARYGKWLSFAFRWAELVALVHSLDGTLGKEYRKRLDELTFKIDASFVEWILNRFSGLINLPPVPPVMVHHIPRFLARHFENAQDIKVAFLLIDGLSLSQWVVLRNMLKRQVSNIRFQEDFIFSWVPTITSVSRQAAFSGKPPIYFPATIFTTSKEADLWTQFWRGEGLNKTEVGHIKGLGIGGLDRTYELLDNPRLHVVGLIINKVDRIMHGMELGMAGMHNQVKQWAEQGFMKNLVDFLLEKGFTIYLSSDHGNVEAEGIGWPKEGNIADKRGERVRIYSDPLLREGIKKQFQDALEWPTIGLHEDFLPLIAPLRKAFTRQGELVV